MDGDARGSHLRLTLAAQGARGGLWVVRQEREVREGLRQGVGQGDEPRPLRPRLQQGAPRHRGGVTGRSPVPLRRDRNVEGLRGTRVPVALSPSGRTRWPAATRDLIYHVVYVIIGAPLGRIGPKARRIEGRN